MFQWLDNTRVSITQGLLAFAAVIIGVLVVAFKVQGGRLHKAQVEALAAAIEASQNEEAARLSPLQTTFRRALEAYKKANNKGV